MSVALSTFTIERHYPALPSRVYAAFADPAQKAKWFVGPDDVFETAEWELDFRVGGREYNSAKAKNGPQHSFEATYLDIVENERIIYSYVMHLDEAKISASLSTIQIFPDGDGTLLTLTEHGAFLDGYDDADSRERGTRDLLDALGTSLTD